MLPITRKSHHIPSPLVKNIFRHANHATFRHKLTRHYAANTFRVNRSAAPPNPSKVPQAKSRLLPHEQDLTEDDLHRISRDIQRAQDPPRNYTKVRQATLAISKKPTAELYVSRAKAYANLRMYGLAAQDYESAAEIAANLKQIDKEKQYKEDANFMKSARSRDEHESRWFDETQVFDDVMKEAIDTDTPWRDSKWHWEGSLKNAGTVNYVSQHAVSSKGTTYNAAHWKKTLQETKKVDEDSRVDRPLTHNAWYFDVLRQLSFVRPELLTSALSSSIAGYQYGVFSVQFFDRNQWHTVVLDNQLPLLENMPRLVRSAEEYDMWPMLIEKAYAKFLGSYSAIAQLKRDNPAYMMEALVHLTGGSFVRYGHDSKLIDLMFSQMQTHEKEQAIIVAYTKEHWRHTTGEYQNGLKRGNYPYIVAKVYSIRMSSGEHKKFVRLRNPNFYDDAPQIWTGRFNYDDNESWTPFLKRELEHDVLLETEFVMEYENYLKYFAFTDMLHTNEYSRDWVVKDLGQVEVSPSVPKQLQITVPKKRTGVFVCVTQLSDEVYPVRLTMYESHKKDIVAGEYLVYEDVQDYDIKVEDFMWRRSRHVAIESTLKPAEEPRTVSISVDSKKPVLVNVEIKTSNKGLKTELIPDRERTLLERIDMDWVFVVFLVAAVSFLGYMYWGAKSLAKVRAKEAEDLRRLKAAVRGEDEQ